MRTKKKGSPESDANPPGWLGLLSFIGIALIGRLLSTYWARIEEDANERIPEPESKPASESKPNPFLKADPSSWSKRLVSIGLALAGCLIAIYLTFDEVGAIPKVWEPFFGNGSEVILHSPFSHIVIFPDAGIGAFMYFVEAILGAIGGRNRWRTMPWITISYGLLTCSVAGTGIFLVIAQGAVFEAWCTLCLASAAISIIIAALSFKELLASLVLVRKDMESGTPFWQAFLRSKKHA